MAPYEEPRDEPNPSGFSESDVGLWVTLLDHVARVAVHLSLSGWSLGVPDGDQLHTYSRGFDAPTCARYAHLDIGAPLPGPHTFRTGQNQYFTSRDQAHHLYPATAGIDSETIHDSAAVLALRPRHGTPIWYLALHFPDVTTFDTHQRRRLERLADSIATVMPTRHDSQASGTPTVDGASHQRLLHAAAVEAMHRRLAGRRASRRPIGSVAEEIAVAGELEDLRERRRRCDDDQDSARSPQQLRPRVEHRQTAGVHEGHLLRIHLDGRAPAGPRAVDGVGQMVTDRQVEFTGHAHPRTRWPKRAVEHRTCGGHWPPFSREARRRCSTPQRDLKRHRRAVPPPARDDPQPRASLTPEPITGAS